MIGEVLSSVAPIDDLFEANPLAIVIVDADDRIYRLNRAFTELFGFTADEARHRRLSDLVVPPERIDESLDSHRRALSGARVSLESVRRHKNGSLIDVAITAVRMSGHGARTGNYVVYRDISDRVSADAERTRLVRQLGQERSSLEAILRALPLGVVAVEAPTGRIALANDRVDERVRRCLRDLEDATTSPDVADTSGPCEGIGCPVRRAMSGATVTGAIWQFDEEDGTQSTLSINAAPIADARGTITGAVASFEDITSKRRLEDAYRMVVERSLQGFAILQAGRVVFANARFADFLGCGSTDEVLALTAAEIVSRVHPDDREAVHERARAQEAGQGADVEYELRTVAPGRPVRHFRTIASAVTYNGRPASQLAVVEVTEQERLRQRLEQARHLEIVGKLSAGLAHELNTPSQYIGDNLKFIADAWSDIAAFMADVRDLERDMRASGATTSAADALAAALGRMDAHYLTEEVPRAIAAAKDGNRRVARTVAAMKALAETEPGDTGTLDLNATIEMLLMTSRHEWESKADVMLELAPDLGLLPCRPANLSQALLNIILSLVDHRTGGGSQEKQAIVVGTRRLGEGIELTIAAGSADGCETCGCRSGHRSPASGSWCRRPGASEVYDIIADLHGGSLECEVRDDRVMRTRVWLPFGRSGGSS